MGTDNQTQTWAFDDDIDGHLNQAGWYWQQSGSPLSELMLARVVELPDFDFNPPNDGQGGSRDDETMTTGSDIITGLDTSSSLSASVQLTPTITTTPGLRRSNTNDPDNPPPSFRRRPNLWPPSSSSSCLTTTTTISRSSGPQTTTASAPTIPAAAVNPFPPLPSTSTPRKRPYPAHTSPPDLVTSLLTGRVYHWCGVPGCMRSFIRRGNLYRHERDVHGFGRRRGGLGVMVGEGDDDDKRQEKKRERKKKRARGGGGGGGGGGVFVGIFNAQMMVGAKVEEEGEEELMAAPRAVRPWLKSRCLGG